jgi:hypothetical protein
MSPIDLDKYEMDPETGEYYLPKQEYEKGYLEGLNEATAHLDPEQRDEVINTTLGVYNVRRSEDPKADAQVNAGLAHRDVVEGRSKGGFQLDDASRGFVKATGMSGKAVQEALTSERPWLK